MKSINVVTPVAEWRDPRHRVGLAGEVAAARFLAAKGYRIEAHRFRLGHHDIDLVVRRAPVVAFVEVKTRRSAAFGAPIQGIGWRRRRDLAQLAAVWIGRHGRAGEQYRFDVVSVEWEPGSFPHIVHTPDAWRLVDK